MSSNRIGYIDLVKAVAILLVVWGHIIQQGVVNCWHENTVISIIYSFHMPLFFIVSGMFMGKSFSLSFGELIKKRGIQLLIPAFVTATILTIIKCIVSNKLSISFCLSWFKEYIPWFLMTLFICSMVIYIAIRIFRRDWLACVMSTLLLLIIPYDHIVPVVNSYLIFIWIGYFIMKYMNVFMNNIYKLLPLCIILFVILFQYWDPSYMVINTKSIMFNVESGTYIFLKHNFIIWVYRLVIGLCGSLSVFIFSKLAYDKWSIFRTEKVAFVGMNTLGIYVLQIYGEHYFFSKLGYESVPHIIRDAILLPLTAIAVVCVISILIYWIRKNKLLSVLFLGDYRSIKI